VWRKVEKALVAVARTSEKDASAMPWRVRIGALVMGEMVVIVSVGMANVEL